MQDSEEKLVRNAMGEEEVRLRITASHYLGALGTSPQNFPFNEEKALRTLNISAVHSKVGNIPGNHSRA